jgi:hypothetical protein
MAQERAEKHQREEAKKPQFGDQAINAGPNQHSVIEKYSKIMIPFWG